MRDKLLILFILTILMFSCIKSDNRKDSQEKSENDIDSLTAKTPIKSIKLLTKLNELIYSRDSLSNDNSTYGKTKSFWIHFYRKDKECYVVTMANFDHYNSKEMDGYFLYKDKVVTVYNSNYDCGVEFINQSILTKGKIDGLIDNDQSDWSGNTPPPPPIVHEPYTREYKIIDADSLILTFDGYR